MDPGCTHARRATLLHGFLPSEIQKIFMEAVNHANPKPLRDISAEIFKYHSSLLCCRMFTAYAFVVSHVTLLFLVITELFLTAVFLSLGVLVCSYDCSCHPHIQLSFCLSYGADCNSTHCLGRLRVWLLLFFIF